MLQTFDLEIEEFEKLIIELQCIASLTSKYPEHYIPCIYGDYISFVVKVRDTFYEVNYWSDFSGDDYIKGVTELSQTNLEHFIEEYNLVSKKMESMKEYMQQNK